MALVYSDLSPHGRENLRVNRQMFQLTQAPYIHTNPNAQYRFNITPTIKKVAGYRVNFAVLSGTSASNPELVFYLTSDIVPSVNCGNINGQPANYLCLLGMVMFSGNGSCTCSPTTDFIQYDQVRDIDHITFQFWNSDGTANIGVTYPPWRLNVEIDFFIIKD